MAGPTILDGGMGSTLEDRGIDVRSPLWGSVALLSEPGRSICRGAHQDFVRAGAELIIANTHNASLEHARRYLEVCGTAGLEAALAGEIELHPGDGPEILMAWLNRTGHALAASAVDVAAKVATCLASPDTPYAQAASLSPRQVAERLRPQAEVLAELGSIMIFEMLTTESDVVGVAELVGGLDDRPPVAMGLVCGEDGRLLGGMPVEEAARALLEIVPFALFIQCTRYDLIERPLVTLVAAVEERTLIGAYGNDGRTWKDGRWSGDRVAPQAYAEAARRWAKAGARMIGGCCGTDPTHIAALEESFRRGPRAAQ